MKNIFAYTPPSSAAGLVPYLSINDAGAGGARVIVRRQGDGLHADIELPEEELERLAVALMRRYAARRATDAVVVGEPSLPPGWPASGGARATDAVVVGELEKYG